MRLTATKTNKQTTKRFLNIMTLLNVIFQTSVNVNMRSDSEERVYKRQKKKKKRRKERKKNNDFVVNKLYVTPKS